MSGTDCSAVARGKISAIRTTGHTSKTGENGLLLQIPPDTSRRRGYADSCTCRRSEPKSISSHRTPKTKAARSEQMNCMSALKVESGTRGRWEQPHWIPHFWRREGNLSPLRVAATADFTAKRHGHLTREQHCRTISGSAGRVPNKTSARNARRVCESGGTGQATFRNPNGTKFGRGVLIEANQGRHQFIVTVTKRGEGTG